MRLLALPALVAGLLATAGVAQPPATDRVYVRDKGNRDAPPKLVEGEVKATAGGFAVVAGTRSTPVSAADVVRVIPGELPGVDRKDVLDLAGLEEKREWAKARDGYARLQGKGGLAGRARRFVDFKAAVAAARAADDTADEAGWKEQAEAAAKRLDEFAVAHPGGWEAWAAARPLARLQLELDRPKEAAEAWARAGRSADLPADLKAEAGLQEVDALIRARQFPAAAARADALAAAVPAGPLKDRLAVLRLAADGKDAAAVEAEAGKARDPGVRAAGYAAAAELYLAANKPREAMWALLWVEVVHNQDRDEVARALARLAELFKADGDDERAKAYREKLRRHRAGL